MATLIEQETITAAPLGSADTDVNLAPRQQLQRRTLAVLAGTQMLGIAGLAGGGTVGALLGRDLLGGTTWAGLPSAFLVVGTAATAVPLSRYMARAGRRPGLRLGWLLGIVGATVVVVAAVWESAALLLAGMMLVGSAAAAGDAAKYAAADLALPAARGAAIGMVVSASTVSAVAGPNLAGPTANLARAIDLPELAGPYLLAIVAFALAALVLTLFLRPDPLTTARQLAQPATRAHVAAPQTPLSVLVRRPDVPMGMAAMASANFIMILVMTMAPVHIEAHDGSLSVVGFAVSAHIAGMFALSPLTGRLSDRMGRTPIIGLGGCWLLAAGTLAALAGSRDTEVLILSLVLLGVGWNFGWIGGSALLTDAVPERDRPRVQGVADATAGLAGMVGSIISGLLLSAAGFAVLGLLGGTIAAALCGGTLLRATNRPPARATGERG